MNTNKDDVLNFLAKWKKVLRLQDWDIKYRSVEHEWRKTGDIKIDINDRTAILLINTHNPKQTNLEAVIIHELIHLKLWEMDQMIESLINAVYGENEDDPKRELIYSQFMNILEYTTNDLAKGFLELGGIDKSISFGRLETKLREEFGDIEENK